MNKFMETTEVGILCIGIGLIFILCLPIIIPAWVVGKIVEKNIWN